MAYKNFSQKSRHELESMGDLFNSPHLIDNSLVNENKIKTFQSLKPKWRELCSYYRTYPDHFIDFIKPDKCKIDLYFYQRVYLRIMMRYKKVFLTATRGTSKCVSGDTLLFTTEGIKEIGELVSYSKEENQFDYIIELLDGFNNLNKTNTVFINGKKKTKHIVTSDGYELEGSYNHPILTMNKNGEYDFKNLEDVKTGDYIAISRGNEIFGDKVNLNINMNEFLDDRTKNQNKGLIHCNIPSQLTNDLAYYLGLLVGDGCLTRNNVVIFTSADKELVDFFIKINKDIFTLKTRRSGEYGYIVHNIYFRELLKQLGLDNKNAHNKEIPKCILNAPKNIVSNFISGLFDTDGMVDKNRVSYCTSSLKLSKQLQIVLSNFGIICNRTKRFSKEFNTYHYVINIYGNNIDLFNEKIGFKLNRKQNILNEIYKKYRNTNKDIIPYQEDKIIRITNKNKHQNDQTLKRQFEHIRHKNNKLTYQRLKKIYSFKIDLDEDYISLIDLDNLNYYWDHIVEVNDSYNYVYDICVENSHTFVGNSIINHNSFLENLAFVLRCIMYPGTKLFITAPGKEQAAKISQDCLEDIFSYYPLLRLEVKKYIDNTDYTKLIFFNGSRYDVVQTKDSTRGGRRNGGAVEEISDKKFNGDLLHSVVIPLMANDRIAMCKGVDSNELHKSQLYCTTAGTQQQFSYEKMKEIHSEMLAGKSAFNIGNSYELPCMHNQLDIDFVEELRESPTYSIMDFMREYESAWTGSSSDNLVSDEKLNKCRTLGVAEWEHCGDKDIEYCLSYDVARNEGDENALSCLCVIKITLKDNGDYVKELVNIFSMEGTHDYIQAKFLKEQVNNFKARILIIDAAGLGSGVVDACVLDLDDGNPPYSVVNDERYDKFKTDDSIPMVFALKAQNKDTRNGDMINNFMKVFNRLDISLLKTSHEGIKDLEKKYKRKIKDAEERVNLEIPYLLTSVLCEEILNLKYKQAGNEPKVEQITRRIRKDKYSALLMGLYWIYLKEQDNKIKYKENIDDYMFFISAGF